MKVYFYLLINLTTLLCFGCTAGNEEPDTGFTDITPELPDALEIDLNSDGKVDFEINHGYVDIEPFPNTGVGDFGIIGWIDPAENNQVLTQKDEENLFLRDLDQIKDIVVEPHKWSTAGSYKSILSIYTTEDGQWPTTWQVASTTLHDTYFIGLKVNGNSTNQVGWVEIKIDLSNGNAEVVDLGIL